MLRQRPVQSDHRNLQLLHPHDLHGGPLRQDLPGHQEKI